MQTSHSLFVAKGVYKLLGFTALLAETGWCGEPCVWIEIKPYYLGGCI